MRLYDEEPEIIEEFPLPEVVESKLLPGVCCLYICCYFIGYHNMLF